MFKTILVGTDGSQTAEKAVASAVSMAKAFGAKLIVVSVFRPAESALAIAPGGDMALAALPTDDQLRAVLQAHVDAQIEQCGATDVDHELRIVGGEPARTILDVAEQEKVDLIVVGSRGMTGMRRMLGSVPNTITHHAPCSVLIVETC